MIQEVQTAPCRRSGIGAINCVRGIHSASGFLSPQSSIKRDVAVQPDGYVTLLGLGEVPVAGKTLPELRNLIQVSYSKIVSEQVITVELKEFEKPYFLVGGEVGHPWEIRPAGRYNGGGSGNDRRRLQRNRKTLPGASFPPRLRTMDASHEARHEEDAQCREPQRRLASAPRGHDLRTQKRDFKNQAVPSGANHRGRSVSDVLSCCRGSPGGTRVQETILQLDERHEESRVSLRDVIAPLFRHRRLVLWSFLAIFLGSIVAALLLPKQYQAEMKILVKRERVDPAVSSNKATVFETHSEVTEEQVQSEVELMRSRDLLENVVKVCGIAPAGSANDREPSVGLARAVRNLQSTLQVEPIKKTNLISATYRSSDPVLAARVLNTLANLYLEKHLEVHRLPGAFDFFQKQTERYRNELATSEEHLVGYDRDTGVVSPELEKEITLRKQSEFDAALRRDPNRHSRNHGTHSLA